MEYLGFVSFLYIIPYLLSSFPPKRHTSLSTGNLLEMAFLSTETVDNLKFLKKFLTVFLMLNLGKKILSRNCLLNQRPMQ